MLSHANGETIRVDINGCTVRTIAKDSDHDFEVVDEKGNRTRKDFDEFDNLVKITYSD